MFQGLCAVKVEVCLEQFKQYFVVDFFRCVFLEVFLYLADKEFLHSNHASLAVIRVLNLIFCIAPYILKPRTNLRIVRVGTIDGLAYGQFHIRCFLEAQACVSHVTATSQIVALTTRIGVLEHIGFGVAESSLNALHLHVVTLQESLRFLSVFIQFEGCVNTLVAIQQVDNIILRLVWSYHFRRNDAEGIRFRNVPV